MPNWCYTDIKIKCENDEAARGLNSKIEEWISSDYAENNFGKNWLGNIVGNSGIDSMEDGGDFHLRCRGVLSYLEQVRDILFVSTETAWEPMLKMWTMICDKYLGEGKYKLFYIADEQGGGVFNSNDPAYVGTYYLYMDETPETRLLRDLIGAYSYYELRGDVIVPVLQRYLNTDEKNEDVLLDELWDSPAGKYIEIRRCEYADIDVWG